MLVVQVFRELRNTLGIGFGLESESLALQQSAELLVICNDTIVDDGELPFGIRSFIMSAQVL